MEAVAESVECYVKGCSELGTVPCDRCGRTYCPAHVSQLVIQRRDDSSERAASRDMLARLPTRTETYALCSLCRTKPVPHKWLPLLSPVGM